MFRRKVVALMVVLAAALSSGANAGIVKFKLDGPGKAGQNLFDVNGYALQASAYFGTNPVDGLMDASTHRNRNGLGVRTPYDRTNALDFSPFGEPLAIELLQFALPTGVKWHSIAFSGFGVGELVVSCGRSDSFSSSDSLSDCDMRVLLGMAGETDIYNLSDQKDDEYISFAAGGKLGSDVRVKWVKGKVNPHTGVPVPEPGVIIMLVLGIVGLISHRRFRVKS